MLFDDSNCINLEDLPLRKQPQHELIHNNVTRHWTGGAHVEGRWCSCFSRGPYACRTDVKAADFMHNLTVSKLTTRLMTNIYRCDKRRLTIIVTPSRFSEQRLK